MLPVVTPSLSLPTVSSMSARPMVQTRPCRIRTRNRTASIWLRKRRGWKLGGRWGRGGRVLAVRGAFLRVFLLGGRRGAGVAGEKDGGVSLDLGLRDGEAVCEDEWED
jgi:hypothetical protein